MVTDAVKGYVQLANGLTDVTKDRATAAAKSVAAQSPDLLGVAASTATAAAISAALQVQKLAEDLYVTSRDNRELLLGVIRTEVERVVAALGFAKEADVEAVRSKVDRLEETVEGREGTDSSPSLRAALRPTKKSAPKKVVAKKAAPKKSSAKKSAPKKRRPTKDAATIAETPKVAAKKVAPKKVAPKKVVAKKPASAPETITPSSDVVVAEPVTLPAAPEIVDLTRSTVPTATPLAAPTAPAVAGAEVPEAAGAQALGDGAPA